ncbi:hypothetical protein AJ80_01319 [Polytolypa hystricis UAMH7299]|uniref:NECAP PHear domain-containing protein n=1 Tax=Polytolypa hystricis (strain UAMH7299) TaxID=1447883 RepID=A0A2B7Z270_POLH7|nr:hypothetical protein AJ80_01319 [Polytolypa hystricis UAMH7299]
MSGPIDPATGRILPIDAIQRVLFVCQPVHVYAIPPLSSMKGYTAADWTVPDPRNNGKTREIFTARLRILETAIPTPAPSRPGQTLGDEGEKVKTDILLEDPNTGSLFAAAPYTDAGVVEHTLDSSRFFAVRVVGDGRKAVLGVGFEDRSEAFDFGVTLQEARKVLGLAKDPASAAAENARKHPRGAIGRNKPGQAPLQKQTPEKPSPPKDYRLKPGETISINIGRKAPESDAQNPTSPNTAAQEEQTALFSIAPPPGPNASSAAFPFLPPPPSTKEGRSDRRRRPVSTIVAEERVVQGFDDDGEFGDFQ